MKELVTVIRESGVRVINFTHYGFLNESLPMNEIATFLNSIIQADFGNVRVAFIDIDSKFYGDVALMLEEAQHTARQGNSEH